MSNIRAKRLVSQIASIAALSALALAAQATTLTFENAGELTANFDTDVFAGDSGTEHQSAYGSSGGFVASTGRFVHFNMYDTGNSLRFIAGPVFLNSFTISSQYAGGGQGAADADNNGRDYTLELYDDTNTLIRSDTLLVGARGSWDTVDLDVAGVRTLRILATWSAQNVFDGWWPNVDNIRFNEEPRAGDVPEPAALALVLTGLLGISASRRRSPAAFDKDGRRATLGA